MARRKLPYTEGDVVRLPIGESGQSGRAVAVLARVNGRRGILGYFYLGNPDLTRFRAEDADVVALAGDLGLRTGAWQVLGPLPGFRRQDWPLPEFSRQDRISGVYRLIKYEEDSLAEVSERRVSAKEAARHPHDGIAGDVAVQIRLDQVAQAQAAAPLRRAG
jgi:hypothetical protein